MAIASEAATSTTSVQNSGHDRCPIDHTALSQQKTGRAAEPDARPIERDAAGVWHVRGFREVQAVLRSTEVKQAGFGADLVERIPDRMTPPVRAAASSVLKHLALCCQRCPRATHHAAINGSTSRKLSEKLQYSHTVWAIISAG